MPTQVLHSCSCRSELTSSARPGLDHDVCVSHAQAEEEERGHGDAGLKITPQRTTAHHSPSQR
eukprot:2796662-Rhodomonas_salina.1